MKQFFFLALTFAFMACGGNDKPKEVETPEGIAQEPAETPTQQDGRQLIANSDCVACHKDEEKVIGPAYKDVAERYHGSDTAVAFLARKIIQGGAGNWGTVPMTAHPQHTEEEAEQMARYILSLHN